MRTDEGEADRPDEDPFAPKCEREVLLSSITLLRLSSGKGGIGGILARRIGRCGELSFLEEGEPGSILLKLYEEKRLEARRSRGSCRDNAANVDLVSAGTSGTSSGDVCISLVSDIERDSDGRLRTGNKGANLGGL